MALSYTHVYDAVRRERSQQDLQELPALFYAEVTDLFSELQLSVRGFDDSSESARIQLLNARKLTKQLYELREQKILQLAQDRCRTGSALVDTSRLLQAERMLFEQLVRVLSEERSRLGVLGDGVPAPATGQISRAPHVAAAVPANTFPPDAPSVTLSPSSESLSQASPSSLSASAPASSPSPAVSYSLPPPVAKRITIKVIKAVPAFVGKGMETYGPFAENTEVELPALVAQVLIRKGTALETALQDDLDYDAMDPGEPELEHS